MFQQLCWKRGTNRSHKHNITVEDSYNVPKVDFCPLCTPGPHVPLDEVNALSLFELFFDDAVMEHILKCTPCLRREQEKRKK